MDPSGVSLSPSLNKCESKIHMESWTVHIKECLFSPTRVSDCLSPHSVGLIPPPPCTLMHERHSRERQLLYIKFIDRNVFSNASSQHAGKRALL